MNHERHGTSSSTAAERVWAQFGQMFGTRWGDQFGPRPNDEWVKALENLRPDQIRGALGKIQSAPLPYPGWLPTLPDFLSHARGIHLPPKAARYQQDTWLDAVNKLFFVWLHEEVNSGRREVYADAGGKPRSIPHVELLERRIVCRRLADDFEQMEREHDPAANRDWLKQAFDRQMGLIPASNPST